MSEIELAFKLMDGLIAATQGLVDYLAKMRQIKADYEAAKAAGVLEEAMSDLKARSDEADASLRAYLASRGKLPDPA